MSSELLSLASPALEAASALAVVVSHGATLTLATEVVATTVDVAAPMDEELTDLQGPSWRAAVLPASAKPFVITL